jgi:hypothetical protein
MSTMAFTFDIPAEGYWAAGIGGLACLLAYVVGRCFLVARPAPPAAESEATLGERFLHGLTRDRRCAPRRRGNTVEVLLSDGSDREPLHAWVLDRSIGGLCLLADQPVVKGTVLRVRPVRASAATPWTDITIRSCREDDGQYELGCQFHGTPNYSLMLMFG